MNALAHMAIGLGAPLTNKTLRLNYCYDKEGAVYLNISQYLLLFSVANLLRSEKLHRMQRNNR